MIIVDDIARKGEREVLRRWVLEDSVKIRREPASRRPFAVVEYVGPGRPPERGRYE
jgi:hypothetical protein